MRSISDSIKNLTTDQVRHTLQELEKRYPLPHHLALFYDAMNEEVDGKIDGDLLWEFMEIIEAIFGGISRYRNYCFVNNNFSYQDKISLQREPMIGFIGVYGLSASEQKAKRKAEIKSMENALHDGDFIDIIWDIVKLDITRHKVYIDIDLKPYIKVPYQIFQANLYLEEICPENSEYESMYGLFRKVSKKDQKKRLANENTSDSNKRHRPNECD